MSKEYSPTIAEKQCPNCMYEGEHCFDCPESINQMKAALEACRDQYEDFYGKQPHGPLYQQIGQAIKRTIV